MKYQPVIGLEVHIELNTDTKMFCECPAYHFSKPANTQTCPVCLGMPGALPYANEKAVENTIKFGLALGCEISNFSKWDRKHYRYPDLPKGYQISQYDLPLCKEGKWSEKRIKRIHLEEDTGKLVHQTLDGREVSLVDFNRSGVALMEMVTEPDFDKIEDAIQFLKEAQLIARYLGVSDADMEKGSMRLEANISMKEEGSEKLPDYKIELKNINSFKYLENAVKAEIIRQTEMLESGQTPLQETRGYDENKKRTFSQRIKEGSADYRYFPEPDLPPLIIGSENVESLRESMGTLPKDAREKLSEMGLSDHYIETLVQNFERYQYFLKAVEMADRNLISEKLIANVMVNQNLDQKQEEPGSLIKYLLEIQNTDYSTLSEVDEAVNLVLSQNQKPVIDYKEGKTQVVGFLVGMVQKELKGKGNAKQVSERLIKKLEE